MKIINFPELCQTTNWDCGVSALQSVLIYYGFEIREAELIKDTKVTKGGMKAVEIKNYAKKCGLKAIGKKMTVDDIKKYIDKDIPVIMPIQAWSDNKKTDWANDWDNGHYVIAIGYDRTKLIFEDPLLPERDYLTYKEFEKRWHDVDRDGKKYINYGIVIYGKKSNYHPDKPVHME